MAHRRMDSKGRHQCVHWCKQHAGRVLFSPWESPNKQDGIPEGCWLAYFSRKGKNANESLPVYLTMFSKSIPLYSSQRKENTLY